VRLTKTMLFLVGALLLLSASAFSQQDYVGKYEAFGGYSFLDTPKLNLLENGVNGQFGTNLRRWLAVGTDFSWFYGGSNLYPYMLSTAKQQQLGAVLTTPPPAGLGGLIPPGYVLYAPYNAKTFTFTAGPQLNYRHFAAVTFFVHPSIGGLYQSALAKPKDPIQQAVVIGLLGPGMKKTDLVLFYGIGGGLDMNVSQHVSVRFAADFVHTNLFSGLLNGGQNNFRFSCGPAFHWGKNVEK
jgi:hypothetical protein